MKDTRMKFPPAYSRHLKTRLQRFLLAGSFISALLPASLLGREYRFVYYEAGPYPVSRTLQGEYRDEVRRLAPDGMEIVYPPNGYMSANWDREKCKKMAKQISRDKKFDLVVAMGPWTVEDLIEAGCKKPIVLMGRFDPILEGIADSKGRPKYKNLTVRIRPGKVESDLQALTTVFKAKRIGLLYFPTNTEFDTVEKYIRKQAAKVGATIVAVPPDPKKAIYQFFKKTKGLARKIDALYLTPLFGLDLNAMNAFFTHLEREGIPAFSSEGFFQVERGAFASNTAAMISGVARYHADKTIRILQGASPASLPTVFRDGRRLSLNLTAYQKAGQEPPAELVSEAKLINLPADPGATLYSLADAIEEALRVNPEIQATERRLEAARIGVGETRSAYLPHLSASAYLREFNELPPVNAFGRFRDGRRGYDFTLSQKVFDLASFRSTGVAKTALAEAGLDQRIVRVDLQYKVALAYLSLAHAYDVEKALRFHREQVYRGLQESLTQFQMQAGSRLDLIRWEQEKERASARLSRGREEITSAMTTLLALLARPTSEGFAIDKGYFTEDRFVSRLAAHELYNTASERSAAADFWALEALLRSPLMQASSLALARQQALLGVNSGLFFPRIDVSGGYYSDKQFDVTLPINVDEDGWRVEAQVTLPIFEGGRRFKERNRIKAQAQALGFEQDQVSLEVVRETRNAFSALMSNRDQHQFLHRSRRLSAEALELGFTSYRDGEISNTGMLQQIASFLETELGEIDTRYAYWAAEMALYRHTGYGFTRFDGPEYEKALERLKSYQQGVN